MPDLATADPPIQPSRSTSFTRSPARPPWPRHYHRRFSPHSSVPLFLRLHLTGTSPRQDASRRSSQPEPLRRPFRSRRSWSPPRERGKNGKLINALVLSPSVSLSRSLLRVRVRECFYFFLIACSGSAAFLFFGWIQELISICCSSELVVSIAYVYPRAFLCPIQSGSVLIFGEFRSLLLQKINADFLNVLLGGPDGILYNGDIEDCGSLNWLYDHLKGRMGTCTSTCILPRPFFSPFFF